VEKDKFKLKKDRFSKARGGASQFFNIFCSQCRTWILLYEKDRRGNLFRLYLDRIHAPENLAALKNQYTVHSVNDISPLKCSNCNNLVAVGMIYEPENRLAYRLIYGTYVKQRSGGTIPSSINPTKEKE
jgi:hypothetical protein